MAERQELLDSGLYHENDEVIRAINSQIADAKLRTAYI